MSLRFFIFAFLAQSICLYSSESIQTEHSLLNQEDFTKDTYLGLLPADITNVLTKLLIQEVPLLGCEMERIPSFATSYFYGTFLDLLPQDIKELVNAFYSYEQPLGYWVKHTLRHQNPVSKATFNPDGTMIITTCRDNTAKLWSSNGSFITILQGHKGHVNSAVFNSTGDKIITASQDNTAKLWACDGKLIATLEHGSPVNSASFNPSGDKIVTACDESARIWTCDGTLIATLKEHRDNITYACFSPTGNEIITTSGYKATLWTCNGVLLATLEHGSQFSSAAFHPTGNTILTTSDMGTRLWTCKNELLFAKFFHGINKRIRGARFNSAGDKIITASEDKTAKIWSLDGTLLATLTHECSVFSAEFNGSGDKIVTTSNDQNARIWECPSLNLSLPETLSLIRILTKHGSVVINQAKELCKTKNISISDAFAHLIRLHLANQSTSKQKVRDEL